MQAVALRNVAMSPDYIFLAVSKFYSRIILQKVPTNVITDFRKLEKISKRMIKLDADLSFLKIPRLDC